MQGLTAKRLVDNQQRIMSLWAERAKLEVDSATSVTKRTLADSLPIFLAHLAEGLATNRKVDIRSVAVHDAESVRIGKLHGADRASSASYELTEVVFEYQILRQVIFEVLEGTEQLSKFDRDLIIGSIEQAVNDAAVEFTKTHADLQEKYIATLTHDLRNPIGAAKINAQLILRRPDISETNLKVAGRIVSSLNRADAMLQNLLDASRVRAGKPLSLDITNCLLNSIIGDVVKEMITVHGNRIHVIADTQISFACGLDGIRRTMENLIGNAVKYSTPETPITVSLKKLSKKIQITVHNVGNPIPEREQAVLFEQYGRSKSAELSSKAGWGLGLTMVKGVVDAHQGTIRVESNAEQGTRFIVELPYESESVSKENPSSL